MRGGIDTDGDGTQAAGGAIARTRPPAEIGVTRLARHLGVPVPTAYRMLRALERAGYVEQLAESK